jgi:uncharacterized protein (TIGR04255 family)
MDEAPSYSRPPVREALIDIRISPLPSSQVKLLETLQEKLGPPYINKKKQQRWEGRVQWQEEAFSSNTSQGVRGYQFENADGTRIVQYQLDGFACNFIKPDPKAPWAGWPALREEARRAWMLYADAMGVTETTGFSVRYINQIVIPSSSPVELSDYLTVPPTVPQDFPYQGFVDYLSSVKVVIDDLNAVAVITQAPAQEPLPDSVNILLDIEVVRRVKAPLDSEAMWTTLDRFRDIKNTIFQKSLRDKAKELFR